jgi:hypothetical protein
MFCFRIEYFPARCSTRYAYEDLADETTEYEVIKDVVDDVEGEEEG